MKNVLRFSNGFDNEAHLKRGVVLGLGIDAGGLKTLLETGLEGNPAVEFAYGSFLGSIGAVKSSQFALAVTTDFECQFHNYLMVNDEWLMINGQ